MDGVFHRPRDQTLAAWQFAPAQNLLRGFVNLIFSSLQIKKSNRASHDRRFAFCLQRRVAMDSFESSGSGE